MNQDYIQPDNWSIIEEGFDADRVKSSESLFSIQLFKEATLQVFTILTKPEWVGGKMVIQSILLKY